MRRFLSYCLVLLLFVGCAKEEEYTEHVWDGPVMELFLDIENDMETKADEEEEEGASTEPYDYPGENMYHENDIKWVDFYFYPGGKTSSQATYHRREELKKLTRDHAAFRFELTTKIINDRIFPVTDEVEGEQMQTVVFALVNVDKTLLDSQDDTSLEALKTVLKTTNFEQYTESENHRQKSFMMSGQTTITLKGRTRKEVIEDEGSTIQLERYACKITVGIKTKDQMEIPLKNDDGTPKVDDDNEPLSEVWTPCLEEMKLYLENGIKTVSLGGEPVDTRQGVPDGYETLTYKDNPLLFFRDEGEPGAPDYRQIFDTSDGYYNTYPTYTYPQHWANGNEGAPFIKLVLPWERAAYSKGGVTYIKSAKKEFYYKILIPNDVRPEYARSFVRNNWYHYNIDVGMLGADTDDTEVELTPTCYVYYWQDKNVVVKHADIGNARYLSVNQNLITINNETTTKINLTSSHPISFRVNSVTRPFYGEVKVKDNGEFDPASKGDGIVCKAEDGSYYLDFLEAAKTQEWFQLDGGAIVMTHALDNNYKSEKFDYSPYTMSVTLWHTDQVKSPETMEADLEKTEYKATVTIIQRPAIYIEEEKNSDPQLLDANGKPVAGDDTENNTERNKNRPVWKNYAHAGYIFHDAARLMRHRDNRNDDGEYGTVAKHLRSGWKATESNAGNEQLEWLQWRTVNFTGGNRCMYTIHVTVLDKDSKYVIGDPRTRVPETWNNGEESASTVAGSPNYYYWYKSDDWDHYWSWEHYYDGFTNPNDPSAQIVPFERDTEDANFVIHFHSARVINDKNGPKRNLTYYYPAENSARTKNMLAPAYRVSSRMGGVEFYNGITRRSAEFKCATYQEDGYPAGRWRLPTEAEVDFIGTLTKYSGFVELFGAKGFYWSANGAKQPSGALETNRDYALARCVYDAWYWDPFDDRLPEDERDNYYFGDLPR